MMNRALLVVVFLAFAAAASEEAKKRKPRTLSGVRWHATLDQARKAAAAAPRKRAARPVLWLRMLGDLAGKT